MEICEDFFMFNIFLFFFSFLILDYKDRVWREIRKQQEQLAKAQIELKKVLFVCIENLSQIITIFLI